jgi:hypothetical protein
VFPKRGEAGPDPNGRCLAVSDVPRLRMSSKEGRLGDGILYT